MKERNNKMKKLLLFAMTAVLAFSVCACSGEKKDSASGNTQSQAAVSADDVSADEEISADDVSDTASPADLGAAAAAFEKVKAQVELPEEMSDFSAKRLERVLGITEDEIEEFAGGVCTDGVKQDQIIYVKAKDESNVADIQEKLQNNLDSIHNVIEKYDPKQKANIENAKVETNGLYVSLVISPDAEAIKSIFSEVTG